MKTKTYYLICLIMTYSAISLAQSGIRRTNERANETIKSVEETQENVESALKLAKSLGETFNLTKKGRKAVILNIVGFKYGDTEIRSLSNSLINEFGKKNVSGSYKEPVVSFEINTRNTGFDVWDMLSPEVTKPFELVEIENGNIIIQRVGIADESVANEENNSSSLIRIQGDAEVTGMEADCGPLST